MTRTLSPYIKNKRFLTNFPGRFSSARQPPLPPLPPPPPRQRILNAYIKNKRFFTNFHGRFSSAQQPPLPPLPPPPPGHHWARRPSGLWVPIPKPTPYFQYAVAATSLLIYAGAKYGDWKYRKCVEQLNQRVQTSNELLKTSNEQIQVLNAQLKKWIEQLGVLSSKLQDLHHDLMDNNAADKEKEKGWFDWFW